MTGNLIAPAGPGLSQYGRSKLPVLLGNLDRVHVYAVFIPPLLLTNLHIIPAHLSLPHAAVVGERPIFEPVTPLPLHPVVHILIFIPKLDCNLVVRKREQLLAQLVIVLFLPFRLQEADNGSAALEEFITVAPDRIFSVGFGACFGIAVERREMHWIVKVFGSATHRVFQRSCAFFTFW